MNGVSTLLWIIAGAACLGGAVDIGLHFYRNTHYDRHNARDIRHAGVVEKQAHLPDGSVLNYGEGPANGPCLMLIHGQMCTWEDYAPVLPALCKRFHVFAVDCYGHGESSWDPAKYTAVALGRDLLWFMDHVIGARTYVSGLSSGGLITAWLAANADGRVIGAVLEDPPMFSTMAERCPQAFAWLDGFRTIHEFLNQTEETNYVRYYLEHCAIRNLVGAPWAKMQKAAFRFLERHPGKRLRLFFLPPQVNRMFDLITSPYDLRFGDTFYDCSWFDGYDREQVLSAIRVPTVLIHTNWSVDEHQVLMAAMSGEDAQRAHELIPGNQLIKVDSGHDFHAEKPEAFVRLMCDFADQQAHA